MNDVLKQMLNDIDVGLKNALIRVNELVAENKALKEALAQSEQEPVGWEQFYPDIGKPQLGQEPVAIYRAGQAKGECFHVEFLKEMGDDEVLLYTTPPKRPWVGLTDEPTCTEQQIANACWAAEISDSKCESLLIALQEAVEAKLKEKNCV